MFSRMKAGMNEHVANNLNMFEESCNEVKNKLATMCRQVNIFLHSPIAVGFYGTTSLTRFNTGRFAACFLDRHQLMLAKG
jgi:hypothetical protein